LTLFDAIDRLLQHYFVRRLLPQFELRVRLHQPVDQQRDAAHRGAAFLRERERPFGAGPELLVERQRGEWHAPRRAGVVDVFQP